VNSLFFQGLAEHTLNEEGGLKRSEATDMKRGVKGPEGYLTDRLS
jgi:hypothetical protein